MKSNSTYARIGLLLAIVLLGLQVASQTFGAMFQYQAALGANFLGVYPPWAILLWAVRYNEYSAALGFASGAGTLATGVGFIAYVVIRHRLSNKATATKDLHGSARFAGLKEIGEAGLLADHGVYVGAYKDGRRTLYLRHSGPEHVLTYAPTRSGKGVGLVVPTLLSWTPSTVVTDLKGELYALTAGWRGRHAGNAILRFEPAAADSGVRWNPVDEIRIGTDAEVGDAQNLALLVVDPDGRGLRDHWAKTAYALITGMIVHAAYKARNEGGQASLASIDAMLSDPNRDPAELWMEMMTYHHMDGANHPVAGQAGRDMHDRPEEEAGSVLSTAKSFLALYRDPVVAANTAVSDFKIKDLMHNDRPVSLYIVTQPNDKNRLRPIVRIMLNMVIRLLADKMDFENGRPKAHYKHRLLLMLDEFPSLGKMEILQESLAFVAGYGIKCYLICQDINQLRSSETGYGRDEQVSSNCHIQNAFRPNRLETAKYLSEMSGETTIVKEQISVSTSGGGLLGKKTTSKNYQETKRALLTPDEMQRLKGATVSKSGDIKAPGDMIVFVAGYPVIRGVQPLYFKDPVFLQRAKVEAPAKSDVLRRTDEPVERVSL